MIDYIKIMNLIIAFIKLTPIPIDVNKLLNDSEVITINLPILPKINLTSNMMINISLAAVGICMLTIILIAIITASMTEQSRDAISSYLISGLWISFILIIIIMITSKSFTNKYEILRNNAKIKYENETIISYQLEHANTLPNSDLTTDDIIKLKDFCYNKPNDPTIYDKGNLYDLPIPTLLKEANIQSIKNLYENIQYLDNYYNTNYIEDTKYHWINTQLNAFYNSNPVDNTNADILKNLKN